MVCKKKGNKHFQKSTVARSLFADSFKLKYIFVFNGLGSFKIWKLFLNYLTCMLLYSALFIIIIIINKVLETRPTHQDVLFRHFQISAHAVIFKFVIQICNLHRDFGVMES